jgi:hypothetical protein
MEYEALAIQALRAVNRPDRKVVIGLELEFILDGSACFNMQKLNFEK